MLATKLVCIHTTTILPIVRYKMIYCCICLSTTMGLVVARALSIDRKSVQYTRLKICIYFSEYTTASLVGTCTCTYISMLIQLVDLPLCV
jgi:hypothetical protein